MAKRIKELSINTLINDGYLQEANRKFFHPFGLDLSVVADKDNGVIKIYDFRKESPRGLMTASSSRKKYKRLNTIKMERQSARRELGFAWEQPIDHY